MPQVTLFSRKDGVVCYAGPSLHSHDPLVKANSASALVASSFEIWWCSTRSHPLPPEVKQGLPARLAFPRWWEFYRSFDEIPKFPLPEGHILLRLPEVRKFTRLTETTAGDLEEDFVERDTDGYARMIAILVGDTGLSAVLSDLRELKAELVRFDRLGESKLKLIYFQLGDSSPYVYTSPNVDEEVRAVVSILCGEQVEPTSVRAYRKLGRARFEYWIDSIAHHDFVAVDR